MEKKSGNKDNRKVSDSHKEGISRVIQCKNGKVGEPGKMSAKPKEKAVWRRSNSASTPRKS